MSKLLISLKVGEIDYWRSCHICMFHAVLFKSDVYQDNIDMYKAYNLHFDRAKVDIGRRSYIQSLSHLSWADSFHDDLVAWFGAWQDDPLLSSNEKLY